jgi:hypothetical protein
MAEAIRIDQLTTRDGNIRSSQISTRCRRAKHQSNSFEGLGIEDMSDADDDTFAIHGSDIVSVSSDDNDEDNVSDSTSEISNGEVHHLFFFIKSLLTLSSACRLPSFQDSSRAKATTWYKAAFCSMCCLCSCNFTGK